MRVKAQAEFALVLGLIIIAVLVAVYYFSVSSPPSIQPSAMTEDQKAVDAYVKDAIDRASTETLIQMYNNGGYVKISGVRALKYAGSKVAYWQMCDEVETPDIKGNLELGIADNLKNSIPERTSIAGRQLVFDKSVLDTGAVTAEMFENKVLLHINLPTTIDGQPMPQPYTVEVRTGLGRVSNFAHDFAYFQGTFGALEYNLLRLVYRSNPDSCWLPTSGAAEGFRFTKRWNELRGCMEQMIFHTLAHTYDWKQPLLNDDDKIPTHMLKHAWLYEVVKYDGSCADPPCWGQYADLDVNFYYGGQDKMLSKNNPEYYFNMEVESGSRGLMEVVRMASSVIMVKPFTPYSVTYDVSHPVLITVYDKVMERSFRFATFVNIRDSTLSHICGVDLDAGDVDLDKACLDEATEDMDLTVTRPSGEGLAAVMVNYDSCTLSKTDEYGNLNSKIRNANNGLLKLESGNAYYSTCIDSAELSSKTVVFPLEKVFDVVYHWVVVEKNIVNDKKVYRIKDVRDLKTKESVLVDLTRVGNSCMDSESYYMESIKDTAKLFATDRYNATVYAYMIKYGGYEKERGLIATDVFTLDFNSNTIHVYAPKVYENYNANNDPPRIKNLFDICNIDAITHTFNSGSLVGCNDNV